MIAENRRLRAENKELRRVNEVLRAASAYFAQEIGPTGGCHEFHWCSWLLGRSRIAGPGNCAVDVLWLAQGAQAAVAAGSRGC
ncbi:putative transposase [Mycobacterium xenopi 3993]|nr:putative transposase [Mycobacterium xenopi 3993]